MKHAIEKSRQKWAEKKDIKPLYSGEGIAVQWPTMEPKPPCVTCLMDPICEDWTDKDWVEFPEHLSTRTFDALSCAEVETAMVLLRMSCPVTRGMGRRRMRARGGARRQEGRVTKEPRQGEARQTRRWERSWGWEEKNFSRR